jgi:hypothetical protein
MNGVGSELTLAAGWNANSELSNQELTRITSRQPFGRKPAGCVMGSESFFGRPNQYRFAPGGWIVLGPAGWPL